MGSGKEVIDQTQDDAKAFGLELPKENKKEEKDFEVLDDNWDALMIFCNMQT